MPDLASHLDLAARAAKVGAAAIAHAGPASDVRGKGRTSIVTSADVLSQRAIVELLTSERPDDAIVGEEGEAGKMSSPRVWFVDPLDGTSNYTHGFPFYCVAIGYAEQGQLLAGAVYDPLRDELFTAARGRGAQLNGVPITVSATAAIERAMIMTGLQSDDPTTVGHMLDQTKRLTNASRAVRIPGCPGLSLAYIARGRCEAFCHRAVFPWDYAAGALLVQEAGGRVTTYDAGSVPLTAGKTMLAASNGHVHERLLQLLAG